MTASGSIYSIVWTLESLALEQAFTHITPRDIEELEQLNEILNKTMKNGNQLAKLQADNEFHDKIIKLSNNTELPKLLSRPLAQPVGKSSLSCHEVREVSLVIGRFVDVAV